MCIGKNIRNIWCDKAGINLKQNNARIGRYFEGNYLMLVNDLLC